MNILLVCSAGMSTSLLVTKMEAAAKAKGVEAKIWAVAGEKAKDNLPNADVLLLGPQVRYLKGDLEKAAAPYNVPVDIITPIDYGRMNGEAVLDRAIELINQSTNKI